MRNTVTYRGERRNAMRKGGVLSRWRELPRLRTKLLGTRLQTLRDGTKRVFEVATYIVGGP